MEAAAVDTPIQEASSPAPQSQASLTSRLGPGSGSCPVGLQQDHWTETVATHMTNKSVDRQDLFSRDEASENSSPGPAPTEGPLAQAQAAQVVGLGAQLAVTQHQLAAVATAEALVLRPPLPFPLGSAPPGFLLGLLALFL